MIWLAAALPPRCSPRRPAPRHCCSRACCGLPPRGPSSPPGRPASRSVCLSTHLRQLQPLHQQRVEVGRVVHEGGVGWVGRGVLPKAVSWWAKSGRKTAPWSAGFTVTAKMSLIRICSSGARFIAIANIIKADCPTGENSLEITTQEYSSSQSYWSACRIGKIVDLGSLSSWAVCHLGQCSHYLRKISAQSSLLSPTHQCPWSTLALPNTSKH
jgi:hypothetical protein